MVHSNVAKSEYWKHFSGQLSTDVHGSSVTVSGGSGFYVPQQSSVIKRAVSKAIRVLRQPGKAVTWVRQRLAARFAVPRMMSYENAFDAVMTQAEVSVPILSNHTVNHRSLLRHEGVFANARAVSRHYKKWSRYKASANIFGHYYYQNLLRGYTQSNRIETILEIGAGNGNFPSIFYHDWAPVRVVLIDLPETLAVAISFLTSLFPAARVVMPNEIQANGFPREFDFAFLTVDQLALLPDNSIDLAINCHSFQEMTHDQIRIYLELVQRVGRESAFLFVANRTDKIPCGPDAFTVLQPDPPNRMAEYPWSPQNEVLLYEVSKLSRLAQLDAVSIRLERIRKNAQR